MLRWIDEAVAYVKFHFTNKADFVKDVASLTTTKTKIANLEAQAKLKELQEQIEQTKQKDKDHK